MDSIALSFLALQLLLNSMIVCILFECFYKLCLLLNSVHILVKRLLSFVRQTGDNVVISGLLKLTQVAISNDLNVDRMLIVG